MSDYLAFSRDGKIIAGASSDHTIKLWRLSDISMDSQENQTPYKVLPGHQDLVRFVIFSPNGRFLASGSGDKTLKLWDTETWECIVTFDKNNGGHEHWVRTLAFSNDGNLLVSGSWDQTIKVWNIKNQTLIQTISDKPYTNMNITNIRDLSDTEKQKLKALGAVDETN